MDAVLHEVRCERLRQDELVRNGTHPFRCADAQVDQGSKLLVLSEEFGEVAKAAYELKWCSVPGPGADAANEEYLRTELIQLAAVAVAWAESLTSTQNKS